MVAQRKYVFYLVIYTHPMVLKFKPTTSPSTYHLQGEEVSVELELIGSKENM